MELPLYLKAILLGIVEGLTEFLPISSTAHLILAAEWLGFEGPMTPVFNIAIQSGAILAVCWLYRKKLFAVALNPLVPDNFRFIRNVTLGFLPAAMIGLLFHDQITHHLFSQKVIAAAFILGGIAIIAIERRKTEVRVHGLANLSARLALMIGLIQCLALIPGVSRSGATIMGGLLMGLDRKAAAEFSFFLAIPTIFGASLYGVLENWKMLSADYLTLILVGAIVSFFTALIVIKWLVGFVSRSGFTPFAWYRIAAGVMLICFY